MVNQEDIEYKRRQQKIFDSLAQSLPPFLRSIGRAREHRLGFNFYRYLHNVKTKKIFDKMGIKPASLVLDIGCNDGEMLNSLYWSYGTKGVGVDFSLGPLKKAKRYNFSQSRYYLGDADNLPFKGHGFDNIICFSVFEHLPDIRPCVAEMKRVLKKGGRILIYAINAHYRYTWNWWKKKIFLSRYDYDVGAFHAHKPAYFVDSLYLKKLLEDDNKIKVNKIIYFHSFFTMLYDDLGQRTILRLVCLSYLIKNYFCINKNLKIVKPDIILSIYNLWLKIILPFLEFLDRPLSERGKSNGFYLLAQKE